MRESPASRGIWFPQWSEVLSSAQLPPGLRTAYRQAVVEYLSFCKRSRQRATLDSARQFMQQAKRQRRLDEPQVAAWKSGLNWFFKEGARQGPASGPPPAPASQNRINPLRSKEPPLAAFDLGGPAWEQQLIRTLRSRHCLWRTEQTYRLWGRRFARWLEGRAGGRQVQEAEESDLRDFLSDLATRQRVIARSPKLLMIEQSRST